MVRRSLLDAPKTRRGDGLSLGEVVCVAASSLTNFDRNVKNEGLALLQRTGVGYSGPSYGFTLPTSIATSIVDKARQTDGPWKRCQWWRSTTREKNVPAVNEISRQTGSRWGGLEATWGLSETLMPGSSQSALGLVNFYMKRLLIFTGPLSRDLWADTELMGPWLEYTAISEMRASIELAMILGASGAGPSAPEGVIESPATAVIAKDGGQSSGTISATNITGMWGALGSAGEQSACWHANKQTIKAIDNLAASGQFPPQLYFPRGYLGNQYATIFGADLIPSDFCPNIGAPGDLLLVDWSQYAICYYQPKPTDSVLGFTFGVPSDVNHQGVFGMPEGAVEQRMSEDFYFTTDSLAFAFKFRGDGRLFWLGPSLDFQGNSIYPAAVIAKR